MFITDIISVTELSRLTGKSRPTIYKYINDYTVNKLDDIPYSFVEMFKMSSSCSRNEIIEYCQSKYGYISNKCDEELQQIIALILKNKEHINIQKLKDFLLEEIQND